ncbi:unnamed protein product, partial [Polarella glacialis]
MSLVPWRCQGSSREEARAVAPRQTRRFATALLIALLGPVRSSAAAANKASFTVRAQLLSGWPRTPSAAQSLEWLRDIDADEASAFLRELGNGHSGGNTSAEARLLSSSARTFHELLVRNSY